MLIRLDISAFAQALASAIGTDGHDAAFGAAVVAWLRTLVAFDHSVVFAYRGDERPLDLFDSFAADEHHVFVDLYQAGPYLLDPFYRAARESRSGFWRMRQLAPDRFYSSEYFRSYYGQTGLAEEAGFFVPVDGGVTIVWSLMRRERSGIFPAAQAATLAGLAPLVGGLVARRWSGLASRFDAVLPRRARRAVPEPASVWRALALTAREATIVELVLQGHSSDAIARQLDIANGTVKVHRRNVYRKLGISSQVELLSVYLRRLAER